MEPQEEYLSRLLSQKQAKGLPPDLEPGREAVLADKIKEVLGIFDGVSTEEALATLQSLQALLRKMEERTESKP